MKQLLLIYILLLPVLSFSQNVQNYNKWVYDGDKNIIEYEIPDGVKTIAYRAFDNCPNLTKISLPATVSEIKEEILHNCPSMTTIEVHPDNKHFISIDGVLFNRDTTTIVCCPNTKATDDYIIPEKVTTIGDCAFFGCKNLTKLIIPNHIQEICTSAFEECINIISVYIPARVRGIASCAFSICYSLQYFEVEKDNKFFSTIDGVLFNNDKTELISCPNKSEYTIPASTRIIGRYAFQGDKDLKSLIIPNSVVIIEEGALSFCNGLSSITIPNNVRKIENSVFWHSENLSSITIEYGIEKIGDRAFRQCTGLTSIVIPGSVKALGESCFQECTNLTNVTLNDGLEIIGKSAFLAKKIQSITIPGSVKEIGEYAFQQCENLSSIIIENGVEKIDDYAFSMCSSLDSIVIPGSVKEINKTVFWKCENLKSATLQNGVEKIKEYAFYECNNLVSVTIPNSIKEIEFNALPNHTSVKSNGETSAHIQLILNKCMLDVYKVREQYDSVQYCVQNIANILHDNQFDDIYSYKLYQDIIDYYNLISDYNKVKYYCKEGISKGNVDTEDYILAKKYQKIKNYLILQLANTYIFLKEYNNAKGTFMQFVDYNGNYDFGRIYEKVRYYVDRDAFTGFYYYYLLLKMYYELNDTKQLESYSVADVSGYINQYKREKKYEYIYLFNALEYWLKAKLFVLDDLETSMFERYKKILISGINIYGMYNAGFAGFISTIGDCYYHYNNIDSAFAYYSKSFDYELAKLKDNFSFMNTYQRQNYWDEHRNSFENIVKISTRLPNDDNAIEMAYNSLLVSKGLLLASEQNLTSIILDSKDENLKNNFFALKTYRIQLDTIKNGKSRDSIRALAEHLETDLMQRSSQFADIVGYMNVDWQMVKKALGKNDVAIEFFYDRDSLYALVLKKDFESPKLVPLGEFDYKSPFNGGRNVVDGNSYSTLDIYNAVWKPLEKYFSEKGKVYFSPSGKLYNIAIEYAPIDEKRLISEKYKLYRISSTRYLALNAQKTSGKKSAAVFGGIEYNFGEGDWEDLKNQQNETDRAGSFRDVPIINVDSSRSGVIYLPGTKIEAENIANSLRAAQYDVSEEIGAIATEGSFKNLSGSGLKIIHIGTHGFYEPSGSADDNGMTKEDRSLSQSGLLFAGANSALDPKKRKDIPEGVDDGILTAKEISRLDFKNLDLVVLSACQTGLGEVTGEGVFGLQRGFKKAGAQTIIMSLWNVDDYATRLLMSEFYKNLVSGKSKREAFLAAQAYVRHKNSDPKYWAAFIMVDAM